MTHSVPSTLSRSGAGRRSASKACAGVGAALLILAGCERVAGGEALRVGFIDEGVTSAEALRGAELGAEEASHTARLLGGGVSLLVEVAEGPQGVSEAAERLVDRGVVAIVGGFDTASCESLDAFATERRVLFLNVGCRADALRGSPGPYTFHVEASQEMYDAALMQSGTGAVLWHAGLTRFGAAQLNDRFAARFGAPADPASWASWMAVKTLWETASRGEDREIETLVSGLYGPDARFDGHKGQPLTFDPRTRQLQQPLFPDASAGADPPEVTSAELELHAALPTAQEIGLDARSDYLLVSNEGSLDLTVVDLATGQPLARIPVGERPRGIRVDAAGERVYVALSDDAPLQESDGDAIAAFDLSSGREIARFPAGSDPEQFGITPDGALLFSSNEDAGTATSTDLRSGAVLSTVVVGIEPEGVAVSPDGRWVYVTAETSNTVSVIDVESGEVVASFLVDVRPRGVTFSPSSQRAYVTNEITGTVTVVDVEEHQVIGTVELSASAKPVGVVVSPDEDRVYVATGHGNSVAVIDAATNMLIAEVPVGRRPWGIAISPDGQRVYTANGGSNDISEIDTTALRVTRTIPVGDRPWGVAFRGGAGGRD